MCIEEPVSGELKYLQTLLCRSQILRVQIWGHRTKPWKKCNHQLEWKKQPFVLIWYMWCSLLIARRLAAPSSAICCNTSNVFRRNYLKYSHGILGRTFRTVVKHSKKAKREAGLKGGNLILSTDHGISLMRLMHVPKRGPFEGFWLTWNIISGC